MREIKFRALIKNLKKLDGTLYNKIVEQSSFWFYSISFPFGKADYEYELMQYTGLKDKNGVEIYEGDIVVAKNKKDSKNNDWIGIVEDNNYGWLALKYKEYINPSWLGALSTPINEPQNASWIMSNCEVIGNIYENSHLLDNNSLF